MSIIVTCPHCDKHYKVAAGTHGKKVQCQCGKKFRATEVLSTDENAQSGTSRPSTSSANSTLDVSSPHSLADRSSAIERNYAFCCGVTLVLAGLAGLVLPHFDLQLALLQRAGLKPTEIRIACMVAAAVGAAMLFFSQRRNLKSAMAMAVVSFLLLGTVSLLPELNNSVPTPGQFAIDDKPQFI
jgi:hypothetical protein